MKHRIHSRSQVTVGLDIGDKFSVFYSIDADGELLSEGRLKTTPEGVVHCTGADGLGARG